MSLALLKQDLRTLIPQTLACVGLVCLVGSYLMPLEIAFRSPVVFFGVLGNVVYHYYKKKQRRVERLRIGWTVRGNVRE